MGGFRSSGEKTKIGIQKKDFRTPQSFFLLRILDFEEEEKKRKRNDGQRICTAVARKNDADLSRPRRPWRDNETWASTRQIKRRPPHDVHRGGFRRLEGRGEGQRRCPDRAGQWRQCRGHALDRVPPIRARIGSQPSKNTNGHGSVRTSG